MAAPRWLSKTMDASDVLAEARRRRAAREEVRRAEQKDFFLINYDCLTLQRTPGISAEREAYMANMVAPPSCSRCSCPCSVAMIKGKGRGVLSTRDIAKGELVESSHLIALTKEEVPAATSTILKDYVFAGAYRISIVLAYLLCVFSPPPATLLDLSLGSDGIAYLALGIGSLFNHDPACNLEIWLDEPALTIQFIAATGIPAQAELTISYHHLEPGLTFKPSDVPCAPSELVPG